MMGDALKALTGEMTTDPPHSFSGGHGTLMRGTDLKPSPDSKVSLTPMCHQAFGTSRDASAHKNAWLWLSHLLDGTVWG